MNGLEILFFIAVGLVLFFMYRAEVQKRVDRKLSQNVAKLERELKSVGLKLDIIPRDDRREFCLFSVRSLHNPTPRTSGLKPVQFKAHYVAIKRDPQNAVKLLEKCRAIETKSREIC